jgi:predicted component of type VI protein secretion system
MAQRVILTRVGGFNRDKAQEFEQGPIQLGTDPVCDMRFDATWDKSVSPRHAFLEFRDASWWVIDQSRDGTWIEGRKVTQHKLQPGQVLELGRGGPKITFELARREAPHAPMPAARQPPAPSPARSFAAPPPPSIPVAHPLPASSSPHPAQASHPSPWRWLIVVLAAAMLLAGPVWLAVSRLSATTEDAQLAAAARQLEPCVGLVVVVVPTPNGERSAPIATAWAVGAHTFATNAHVAQPVKDALAKGDAVFVVINKNPNLRYKVVSAEPHPKFGQKTVDAEGKDPAIAPYDVGLLTVNETLTARAPMASADELAQLDSGERIAYLGFPMEGLAGGGVDIQNPVATMQSGIVTSVTDYWLSKADAAHRLLIQHNLGATGGASGSPVFNTRGEVVGILCAGNIIGQVDVDTGQETRAPSGVMINFAQRVDVLNDLLQDHGSNP